MKRRIISALLLIVMLISLVPAQAFAQETTADEPETLPEAQQIPAEETIPDEEVEIIPMPDAEYEEIIEEPAEEPAEEPEPTDEPEEDEEPAEKVSVRFDLTPAELTLRVYPAAAVESPEMQINIHDENGIAAPQDELAEEYTAAEPQPIAPEADGTYLLLPGEYCYDAECEGYIPLKNVAFTVSESTEIAVALEADSESTVSGTTTAIASGSCGENLTWTLNENGVLTISGTGDMEYIGEWSAYRENITDVIISDGVTSIYASAFECFTVLESVTIADSVTVIGDGAFFECSALESIVLPDGLSRIGVQMFTNCYNLRSVTVPTGVASIGEGAFYQCRSLESLTIPASATSIEGRAFTGCVSLTSVVIPDSVANIGDYAFNYCTSLTSVTIGNGVTSIGYVAFSDCYDLTSINVASGNGHYASVNGVLFNKSLTELLCFPGRRTGGYTIPNSVTRIGDSAFYCCQALTSVTIPDSVTSIGRRAFCYCTSLTSVTISDSVTSIDDYAFCACEDLTDVYYSGTETQWDAINIGKKNDELLNATIHYARAYRDRYEGKFNYHFEWDLQGSKINKDMSGTIEYYDSFFNASSTAYNHDLAKASIKLAMSAFPSAYKEDKAQNVIDLMENIGCTDIETSGGLLGGIDYSAEPQANSIAFVIGSKLIRCGEKEYPLVIVAIRGEGYKAEWGGNFNVAGERGYHCGFKMAAEQVAAGLKNYLCQKEIAGEIKLWITGYSRAAATANLLAGMLDNGECILPDVKLDRNNIFAYTFETPAGVTVIRSPKSLIYSNIFNIVNPNDFVPKVAPLIWGYQRYGVDCFLPKVNGTVRDTHVNLTGRNYVDPFKGSFFRGRQEVYLDHFISKLSVYLGGELGYLVSGAQGALVGDCVYRKGLPNFEVLANSMIAISAVRLLGDIAANIYPNSEELKFSHYPSNCLAFMESMSGSDGYWKGKYKYYIVKCPVDISVTDSGGNLVAATCNDAVTLLGNDDLEIFIDENGDKYIYAFGEDTYNIKINAYDNGEMDCTVVDFNESEGKTLQTAFFDIPLEKGDEFTTNLSLDNSNYAISDGEDVITPDVQVNAGEMNNITVAIEVRGLGSVSGASTCYTVGDTAMLSAEPANGNIFFGWYQNDELLSVEENYKLGVKGNTAITAVFVSKDVNISLDREYAAMQVGESAVLSAEVTPAEWAEYLTWSAENPTGREIISVSGSGSVTALDIGTAYAVATVSYKDYTFTARCRVDVTEKSVEEEIEISGIELGTTAVTSELYSRNYAEAEILLLLPQNMSVMSADAAEKPEDNGIAIKSARFTDPAAAEMFDLAVVDDRRVAVVPKNSSIENAKAVKSSYTSAVAVTVGNTEFVTDAKLRLTVKKTMPKLKADTVQFNSFYSGQSAPIVINGASVTAVRPDTGKKLAVPAWLTLSDDGKLSLTPDAPKKSASGSAYILVDTEEWAVPAAVTVSVKNTYKAPKLKLSAASVTMSSVSSRGVEMKLMPTAKNETLEQYNVTGLTAYDGYTVENFDAETGAFTLKAPEGYKSGKTTLAVSFGDTDTTVSLPLTVKTAAPAIRLKKTSVTLNPAHSDIAEIDMTLTPADYIGVLNVSVTNASGTAVTELDTWLADGKLYVHTVDATKYNTTYKVSVSVPGTTGRPAVLTVRTSKENMKPSVTVRAAGAIDLTYPDSAVTLTPTFKNFNGGFTVTGGRVTETKGRTAISEGDLDTYFTVTQTGNTIRLEKAENAYLTAGNTYTAQLTLSIAGMELTASAKITVKATAVNLRLSKSALTLNKLVNDASSVAVTCTTKNYVLGEPVISVMDKTGKNSAEGKLDTSYSGGTLYVSVNEATEYGASYKVLISASEGHRAATLTVTIPAQAKSAITGTLKVKGSIDIIRSGSGITLTPTYKNVSSAGYTERVEVYSSADKFAKPVEGVFAVDGMKLTNICADSRVKYKVRVIASFASGAEAATPLTAITVKTGAARLTVSGKPALYLKDVNSRGDFRITSADLTLNGIAKAEIKDAKNAAMFELYEYGGGRFAIGFKDGVIAPSAAKLRSVSIPINIWLDGNETAKPNTTVTVKINIAK